MDKIISDILQPGETVLWSARPDPWHYTRPTLTIYLVAVPWAIFTYYWLDTVTGGFKMPGKVVYPYPAWTPWAAIGAGIILLIAALWMLSAPYWIWRKSIRTIHLVTDRRALILLENAPAKTSSLTLSGTVSFRIQSADSAISDLEIISGQSRGLLFRATRDPQAVVATISAMSFA